MSDDSRTTRLWLAGISLWILGTTVIQMYLADSESFWLDELTSYWFSSGPNLHSVFDRMIARADAHPPGYQVLLYLWFRLDGVAADPLAARALSIVSFVAVQALGAWLVYRVTRRVRSAALYCVFAGTATYVSFYGVELRSYMTQQAAFVALLLAREIRAETGSRRAGAAELVSAFYLALSHYVATLLVIVIAGRSVIQTWVRDRRFSPRAIAYELGYAPGVLLAVAWFLCGPDRSHTRHLPIHSPNRIAGCFIASIGRPQLLVMVALLCAALVTVLHARHHPKLAPGLLERLGVVDVGLLFAVILLLEPIRSVIQARNVLLLLPPVLAALAALISLILIPSRRGRWLLGCAAVSLIIWGTLDVRKEARTPERHGEDFVAAARLTDTLPLVVGNDDIGQKVVDAEHLLDQPLRHEVYSIRSKFGVLPNASELPRGVPFYLACLHCDKHAAKRLLRFAKKRRMRCKKQKLSHRDFAFRCTAAKGRDREHS